MKIDIATINVDAAIEENSYSVAVTYDEKKQVIGFWEMKTSQEIFESCEETFKKFSESHYLKLDEIAKQFKNLPGKSILEKLRDMNHDR